MRPKLVSIFVVLLMTASIAWGQGSDTYRYLVTATNEMSKIVGQSAAPDKGALLHVTAQACDALSMLLEDPQFYEDLSRLHDEADDSTGAREELKHELYLFVSSFLRIEDRALRDAGVDESAAKEILWVASMFREEIDADVTPEDVFDIVSYLKQEVCEGAKRLQIEEDNDKRWAMVRRWSFRIGGVTLIVVDVGGAAISAGVTTPVALGSVAIGKAIASWGD